MGTGNGRWCKNGTVSNKVPVPRRRNRPPCISRGFRVYFPHDAHTCVGVLCCIFAAPLFAAEWLGYPTQAVIVFVHPGQQQDAQSIGTMAMEELPRVAAAVGLRSVKQIVIIAYDNRAEFLRDAGPYSELLGVSYRPSGLIRIDISGVEGPVRPVLAHEMTHTLLTQRLDTHLGNLPTWVNEGIAVFFRHPPPVMTCPDRRWWNNTAASSPSRRWKTPSIPATTM